MISESSKPGESQGKKKKSDIQKITPTRTTFQFHKALKNLKEMQENWSRVKDPPFSPKSPSHPSISSGGICHESSGIC
jgi:hypothetical protein